MPEHKMPSMPKEGAPPLRGMPVLVAVQDVERLTRIHFDESRMFELLRLVRTYRSNKFPDDASGNARVRRIIDYLILIDGDMHGGFESVHEKR